MQFEPGSEPRIHVETVYHLRNTGNQPLSSLEVRLPGRTSFRVANPEATWDNTPLSSEVSASNPRDTIFQLPSRWNVSDTHTFRLSSIFQNASGADSNFSFTSDAFFLPSEGWAPELLPARGFFFATGGVPPQKWPMFVRVPEGFLVHVSGRSIKTSHVGRELTVQALQTPSDRYPFVIAGMYQETSLDAGQQKVRLWARSKMDPATLRTSLEALSRVIHTYDQAFGNRTKSSQPFWIVECPVVPGCFAAENSRYGVFLGTEPGSVSSELASADTLMVNSSEGAPKLAVAAPGLAASWLGYGQNPGFYDQQPPLSAFPAFAASLGREAVLGESARVETIRRALQAIPKTHALHQREDGDVLRAKSFLFFYALQDRYGPDVFHRAIDHMLSARNGHGFDLADLIAAFEQEAHQNVAEFVRLWMKHPGVPDDFRARYESSASALVTTSKENMP